MEAMIFTSYHVGQMKGASDWTVFKTTRTYENLNNWPKSSSEKAFEHVTSRSYANILMRMLNGNVKDVTGAINALSGVTVQQADGQHIPVLECPLTALEH